MSDFLSRWSRRKIAARQGEPEAPPPPVPPAAAAAPAAVPPASAEAPAAPAPLPPLESLTPESDFAGFMQPEVEPGLRREALKTLFADPRFNVMDGLDTYIDDYSKPDPLPEGWLEKMTQVARLGEYREPEPVGPEEQAPASLAPPPAEAPAEAPGEAPANPVSTPATGNAQAGESAGKNAS